MHIEDFKQELKDLLAENEIKDFFNVIDNNFKKSSALYNNIIIQKNRHSRVLDNIQRGIHSNEEIKQELNSISDNLLAIIGKIKYRHIITYDVNDKVVINKEESTFSIKNIIIVVLIIGIIILSSILLGKDNLLGVNNPPKKILEDSISQTINDVKDTINSDTIIEDIDVVTDSKPIKKRKSKFTYLSTNNWFQNFCYNYRLRYPNHRGQIKTEIKIDKDGLSAELIFGVKWNTSNRLENYKHENRLVITKSFISIDGSGNYYNDYFEAYSPRNGRFSYRVDDNLIYIPLRLKENVYNIKKEGEILIEFGYTAVNKVNSFSLAKVQNVNESIKLYYKIE